MHLLPPPRAAQTLRQSQRPPAFQPRPSQSLRLRWRGNQSPHRSPKLGARWGAGARVGPALEAATVGGRLPGAVPTPNGSSGPERAAPTGAAVFGSPLLHGLGGALQARPHRAPLLQVGPPAGPVARPPVQVLGRRPPDWRGKNFRFWRRLRRTTMRQNITASTLGHAFLSGAHRPEKGEVVFFDSF